MARAVTVKGGPLPRFDFVAEADHCPRCSGGFRFHKSRVRTVVTLAEGAFEAREALTECVDTACGAVFGSRALARLVRPRQRFGYDLVVHVGLARYLGGKQREEIREELHEQHGIELSAGSVSALCDRFLLHLEALHLCRAPHLRAAMGGWYPLHLDATCDKGKGGLLVCMDGLRGWVLVAARIPSENAADLRSVVEEAVTLFGKPVATVRDLGEAGAKAVAPLRDAGVPDLVCHRHFLSAVGKKLLDQPYNRLVRMLRASRVRSDLRALLRELRRYKGDDGHDGRFGRGRVRQELLALVLWLLEGKGTKEPDYPFALTHLRFVQRCREAASRFDQWAPCPRSQPEWRIYRHLMRKVAALTRDLRIPATIDEIEERWRAFTELRDVLRLSNAETPGGDTRRQQLPIPAMEQVRLLRIEREVTRYKEHLRQRLNDTPKPEARASAQNVILTYLDDYEGHLFGHPALLDDDGAVLAVVQRTNNPVEHLFGQGKQRLRRRLGRANLGRDLQQQPAQAALVSNLRDPAYVQLVCGSLENLPATFAALDEQAVQAGVLVRDHRDSRLMRRIRELLELGPETSASGAAVVESAVSTTVV